MKEQRKRKRRGGGGEEKEGGRGKRGGGQGGGGGGRERGGGGGGGGGGRTYIDSKKEAVWGAESVHVDRAHLKVKPQLQNTIIGKQKTHNTKKIVGSIPA